MLNGIRYGPDHKLLNILLHRELTVNTTNVGALYNCKMNVFYNEKD